MSLVDEDMARIRCVSLGRAGVAMALASLALGSCSKDESDSSADSVLAAQLAAHATALTLQGVLKPLLVVNWYAMNPQALLPACVTASLVSQDSLSVVVRYTISPGCGPDRNLEMTSGSWTLDVTNYAQSTRDRSWKLTADCRLPVGRVQCEGGGWFTEDVTGTLNTSAYLSTMAVSAGKYRYIGHGGLIVKIAGVRSYDDPMNLMISLDPSLVFAVPDRRRPYLCLPGSGSPNHPFEFEIFSDVRADWLPVEPAPMIVSMQCLWPITGLERVQDTRCSAIAFVLDVDFGAGVCDSVGTIFRSRGYEFDTQEIDLAPP